MKKINTVSLTILTMAAIFFTRCTKKGDTGATGAQGNSNVTTQTHTVLTGDWQLVGNDYQVTFPASNVTQSIINTGTVSCFLSYVTASWDALPMSYHNNEWNYICSNGNITITYSWGSGNTPSAPSTSYSIKVVAIAASAMKAKPNVDVKNYKQIQEAFSLNN